MRVFRCASVTNARRRGCWQTQNKLILRHHVTGAKDRILLGSMVNVAARLGITAIWR
ncbi:hypothetical protein NUKP71_08460 [Klebsiella quasipneumoniae]|nr:hypothetical protein NUKP71_08460 [Klebsiella quasipneumoniae]